MLLRYMHGTWVLWNLFPSDGDRETVAWNDWQHAKRQKCYKRRASSHWRMRVVLLELCSKCDCEIQWRNGMVWHCVRCCGSSREAVFMQGLLERCHCPVRFDVRTDNSAARAIGLRVGSGSIRSLEVKSLWCHRVFQSGAITLSKRKGTMNPADLGTKTYNRSTLEMVLPLTGLRVKRLEPGSENRTRWRLNRIA